MKGKKSVILLAKHTHTHTQNRTGLSVTGEQILVVEKKVIFCVVNACDSVCVLTDEYELKILRFTLANH